MAKASWLNLSQVIGSGDATVEVSSKEEYTGRENRETVITWVPKSEALDAVECRVVQKGEARLYTFSTSINAPYTGAEILMRGESNAKGLEFRLGTGDLELELPEQYYAAGYTLSNGEEVPGDPGKSELYVFEMILRIPANDGEENKTCTINVYATDNSTYASCKIVSTPLDLYIEIEPTGDIVLEPSGEAVSVTVKSNVDWIIK